MSDISDSGISNSPDPDVLSGYLEIDLDEGKNQMEESSHVSHQCMENGDEDSHGDQDTQDHAADEASEMLDNELITDDHMVNGDSSQDSSDGPIVPQTPEEIKNFEKRKEKITDAIQNRLTSGEKENLIKMALNSRVTVRCLVKNLDEVKRRIEKDDPALDVQMVVPKRHWVQANNEKRKRRKGGAKGNPAGEWEVQEIMDAGLDDEGQVLYRVRWKDWDGDDTWEPGENLTNASLCIQEFNRKMDQRVENETREDLIRFNLILMKQQSDPDLGFMIKLLGKDLKEINYTKAQFDDWHKIIMKKCDLILNYLKNGSGDVSPETLLNITIKEFKLVPDKFESLEQFFEWAEGRKECNEGNKRRQDELNQKILELNEGPAIIIENLIDNQVLEKFEYIKESVPFNIAIDNKPLLICECIDCFENKPKKGRKRIAKGDPVSTSAASDNTFCCVHECDKQPYNREGTLLLEERRPIYECNPLCKCGDSCPFKVVSKGRKIKIGIFRTQNNRGWGAKALERIPKGKFVTAYLGDLIQADERDKRSMAQMMTGRTYIFDLDYSTEENQEALFAIDALPRANLARFINHSCSPNLSVNPVWSTTMDLRLPTIAFFSNRTILRGEELSIDYNARKKDEKRDDDVNHATTDTEKMDDSDSDDSNDGIQPQLLTCRCGAENCRGFYF